MESEGDATTSISECIVPFVSIQPLKVRRDKILWKFDRFCNAAVFLEIFDECKVFASKFFGNLSEK